MKKYLYLLPAIALIGCAAPPKPTFEQMSASLEANKLAAVRVYPNKSPKEVMQASHKVLYMLDPGLPMSFDMADQRLYAKRTWGLYLILASVNGVDQYNISAEPISNGTKLSLAFATDSLPFILPANTFNKNVIVGHAENPEDFKLFHDRVEYLLGIRTDWVTCAVAKAKQPDPKKDMFLCDSIGLENISPADELAKNFQ